TATDNSGTVNQTSNIAPGSAFPVGTTEVKYTATDGAGNQSTCSFNVIVNDTQNPSVITRNRIFTLDLDEDVILVPSDIDNGSSDNCGILSYELDKTLFTAADEGENTVTLTVTDINGNQVREDATVTININIDQEPCAVELEISSITGPLDPNPVNSTIQVSATVVGDVVEAKWIWDNEQETVLSAPFGDFAAQYTYTTPGVYQIKLVVKDACGNEVEGLTDLAVIFDPDGGFVTGGGWIWSPKGSYLQNLDSEGRANFGFVAKYRKGSNKVDGHTEFQYRDGNLNFNSTNHRSMSLVVAGHKALYKGEGTINREAGYSFMVSVIDGNLKDPIESDKFRMKIWITDTGELVYDNQIGEDENADASSDISGGSIVIHQPKSKGKNKSIDANGLTIVPWNTPFEEIKDFELLITDEYGQEVNLKVDWSKEGYDPLVSGMYTITGSLMESISLKLQYEVQMYVMVEEKGLPIDIEIDRNIIPKSIVDGEVIGTLRTIDPADDIHTYTILENEFVDLDGDRVVWKGAQFLKNEMKLMVSSTDRVGQTIQREITLTREVIPNQVIVYPNPATSETNVRVDIFKPSKVAIRLYDAKGVLVVEIEEEHSETFIENLNLEGIANGMYQVQVQINHQVITKILVKNN
ncbi:HYR domain-containing protein, partial [Aquiflexum sp.]|uniref:HYR domain-containing protein n=1 Tax=Aquiflexum sp. TaxID=1872584 RepID=UPI003594768A